MNDLLGSSVIEVAIGLVFTYIIFSSITSAILEVIAKMTQMRAKHLKQGLSTLLNDPDGSKLVNELYKHHLIKNHLRGKLGDPTHISAANFSTALFDWLVEGSETADDKWWVALEDKIKINVEDVYLRNLLLQSVKKAEKDASKIQLNFQAKLPNIGSWFDDAMSDVGAWYKSKARWIMAIVSFFLVLGFNVDSIRIGKVLWTDDEVRASVVTAAENYYNDKLHESDSRLNGKQLPASPLTAMAAVPHDSGDSANQQVPVPAVAVRDSTSFYEDLHLAVDSVQSLIDDAAVLPVGWLAERSTIPCCKRGESETDCSKRKSEAGISFGLWLLYKVLGLVITWGAIVLGGTYWFEILKWLIDFRKNRSSVQVQAENSTNKS